MFYNKKALSLHGFPCEIVRKISIENKEEITFLPSIFPVRLLVVVSYL